MVEQGDIVDPGVDQLNLTAKIVPGFLWTTS